VPGSDRELRRANRFDRSSADLYPVWTLRRVAFNQQRGAMGAYGSGREDYTDAAGLLGDYAPIRTTVRGDAEERSDLQPDAGDLQRRFADTGDRDGSFISPASDFQIAEFQLGRRQTGARRRRLDAEPVERHVHSMSGRIVSDDQRRPALSTALWSVDNPDRTSIALRQILCLAAVLIDPEFIELIVIKGCGADFQRRGAGVGERDGLNDIPAQLDLAETERIWLDLRRCRRRKM